MAIKRTLASTIIGGCGKDEKASTSYDPPIQNMLEELSRGKESYLDDLVSMVKDGRVQRKDARNALIRHLEVAIPKYEEDIQMALTRWFGVWDALETIRVGYVDRALDNIKESNATKVNKSARERYFNDIMKAVRIRVRDLNESDTVLHEGEIKTVKDLLQECKESTESMVYTIQRSEEAKKALKALGRGRRVTYRGIKLK